MRIVERIWKMLSSSSQVRSTQRGSKVYQYLKGKNLGFPASLRCAENDKTNPGSRLALRLAGMTAIFCLTFSPAFAADPLSSKAKKLQQIDKQIETTQSQLEAAQQSASELTQKLKSSETDIGEISKGISNINKKMGPVQEQLSTLQQQEKRLNQQLASQSNALAEVLRMAYVNHQETYLKLLLNQQDPQRFSRMDSYYQYYSAAQIKLINSVRDTLQQLHDTQQKIIARVADLNTLRTQRLGEQQQLKRSQQQRQAVLSQIKRQIKTKQQKLGQLLENKANLENLITRLSGQKSLTDEKFVEGRGKLPWPTRGRITSLFGSRQTPQSLPEQGVFIEAPAGQDINAIAAGKVVYADWLKGFGLLVIIDHGKGFMSLYSHCNSLYNKVGDTVTAGAPIATVGNSGGFQESGVLFEIRSNGKAVDPIKWCKGRP